MSHICMSGFKDMGMTDLIYFQKDEIKCRHIHMFQKENLN